MKSKLFWLFIIAIASDPIVSTIQGFYFDDVMAGSQISFAQIFRGVLMLLMLGIIILKYFSAFMEAPIIWPILLMSVYALFMSFFSPFPFEAVAWSFRLIYLAIILIAAYLLALNDEIQARTLWKLAAFVLLVYFFSQILSWYTGYGGLRGYRTEYGSSGFNVGVSVLSWAICGLVPCFFLNKTWRLRDILMIIIAFSAVLLTMRRTAFVALLIVVPAIGIARLMRGRLGASTKIISIVFPITILLCIWYVLNVTEYGYVFMKRLEDLYTPEGTASGRYLFQRIGLDHLFNRGAFPTIFGEGAGYAKILLGAQLGVWIGMHSDWLDIAISYGLIGVSCFAFLFWSVFRLILKTRISNIGDLDALIAVFLLMGFGAVASGGVLDPSFSMPYALLGLMSAFERKKEINEMVA